MPRVKLVFPISQYPNLRGLPQSQRVSLNLSGTVVSNDGANISVMVDSIAVGRKGRVNTQQQLLDKLDDIKAALPSSHRP